MRDGRLERYEQVGLHHRQAHRYRSRGEAFRERAEGAEGLDGRACQGSTLAASYGELSESLQQRVELVMRLFLALGEGVDDSVPEQLQRVAPLEEPATAVMDAESNTASIFGMGRG